MPNRLEELTVKFDQLALRLRIGITIAIATLLFMLFDTFWFSFNDKAIQKTNQRIVNTVKQNQQLISMQADYNQDVHKRRSNPKNIKLTVIKQQIKAIKKELMDRTVTLVQPKEMASVIKTILQSSKALKLQILTKQKSVDLSSELQPNQSPKITSQTESPSIKFYRHSMIIELSGSYSATFEFLKKLESMDKKVTFEHLIYSVDQYPSANIKLTVSTLSFQKGWIGG